MITLSLKTLPGGGLSTEVAVTITDAGTLSDVNLRHQIVRAEVVAEAARQAIVDRRITSE